MKVLEFNKLVKQELNNCKDILSAKCAHYAMDDDRLKHFKDAANYLNITPEFALLSQLTKHLVSIKDMVVNNEHDLEVWQEKITDAINYLLLLYALETEHSTTN